MGRRARSLHLVCGHSSSLLQRTDFDRTWEWWDVLEASASQPVQGYPPGGLPLRTTAPLVPRFQTLPLLQQVKSTVVGCSGSERGTERRDRTCFWKIMNPPDKAIPKPAPHAGLTKVSRRTVLNIQHTIKSLSESALRNFDAAQRGWWPRQGAQPRGSWPPQPANPGFGFSGENLQG